jgi:hypothetical protein
VARVRRVSISPGTSAEWSGASDTTYRRRWPTGSPMSAEMPMRPSPAVRSAPPSRTDRHGACRSTRCRLASCASMRPISCRLKERGSRRDAAGCHRGCAAAPRTTSSLRSRPALRNRRATAAWARRQRGRAAASRRRPAGVSASRRCR